MATEVQPLAVWIYDGPAQQYTFQVKMTHTMRDALKSLPASHGGTMTDHLRVALAEYLDKLGVPWRAGAGD